MNKTGLVFTLLALPAFATDVKTPLPAVPQPLAEATANAGAAAEAVAYADVSATLTGGDVTFRDRRQAPASFAPPIAPTAPCYYGVGGALSIPGGSIGGGKAVKDQDCENRENIRLAYAIGLIAEGDYLFCATIGKDIPRCGEGRAAQPPVPEARPVVVIAAEPCARPRGDKLKWMEGCLGK